MKFGKTDIAFFILLGLGSILLFLTNNPIEGIIIGTVFAILLFIGHKLPDEDAKEKMTSKRGKMIMPTLVILECPLCGKRFETPRDEIDLDNPKVKCDYCGTILRVEEMEYVV